MYWFWFWCGVMLFLVVFDFVVFFFVVVKDW